MPAIRTFAFGVALAALSVSVLPTAASAYTPEEQQACQPDAFRLCSAEIPDVDRVTACMIARKSQLSPECRRFFRPDPEPIEVAPPPAGKPVSIRPANVKRVSAKPATAKPVAAKKPKAPKTKKPAQPSAT
jgi:hypothetical protein